MRTWLGEWTASTRALQSHYMQLRVTAAVPSEGLTELDSDGLRASAAADRQRVGNAH